jgi:hypothetical protein
MTSEGSIAAQYRADAARSKTHYLSIVDVWTGKTRETIGYTHDYQTNGGGMSCHQHNTFTSLPEALTTGCNS